jgi:uncharacterized protein
MIKRGIAQHIEKRWFSGKTIVLLGARQVGKTTLLRQLTRNLEGPLTWINGDSPQDRSILNRINGERAKALFAPGTVVVVDEAQRLDNAGLTLKIIHDSCPDIQLVATGSSSFELADRIKEAMTGRKWTFHLFPFSFEELVAHTDVFSATRNLEARLIFGSYPDVINRAGSENEVLMELTSDYLYKDVFALRDLRKPVALEKLVRALAFQIGHQVSYRKLAQLTGLDKETVERYIWLLEESFIVFRLPSFSRNLRNELKRSRKIYFYDLGIRNAVIQQFNALDVRNDVGQLWENYLVSERRKLLSNNKIYSNMYFWRSTRQQEIDYLEERDGHLYAYEFKWNPSKRTSFPGSYTTAYPDASTHHITPENYIEFLTSIN